MINQERVDFILGETALHHHNEFEKVQVNQEWGPLIQDSLTALKRHYEQLVASPDAVVVGYRFTIRFNDPSYEFTKVHLAKIWFSQVMHRLGGVADNQTASGAFFREAIKNDDIRCFWGSSSNADGSGVAKVYVVAKGSQIHGPDDIETFHKDVKFDLFRSCSLTREDFSGLHEDCSFFPSFATKSSVTLIAPQDENYEMLKGLLLYKLSALTAIPVPFKVDDLISFSVLTKLTERPEDKVDKKGTADKVNNNLKATHSSARSSKTNKDKWQTPPEVFEQLDKRYGFTLDAAAEPETALCLSYFTEEDDALVQDWSGHVVFCHPPYSKLKAFAKKAYEESLKGTKVVMLVPARTGSDEFHDYFSKGAVRFIGGRLNFLQHGQEQGSANFPSMVCILGPGIESKWEYVEKDNLIL
ncbi:DNA N-6-adenine-methyltransferase [Vibrio sp. 10N.261.51.A4]|uniref:DNA N-6-adenine-methyltransferase n=1 Tax=Vibrio sp. 10N.261.51.A4 TaxID=3229674 RepID=UPI00354CF500